MSYTLVATQYSYYSAKVRACLQYKRLPYVEQPSNFDAVFNRVLPATGEAKFPVVFCADGAVLHDSCDIVEALERRHPERPLTPDNSLLTLVSVLLETLADEFFVAPFIYYRWVPEDTREWALDMFRIILTSGIENMEEREKADAVSGLVAGGIQERVHKIGQDRELVQQESQRVTRAICDALERHLTHQPFLLGERPCLADVALMNGFFGHLYMDPCEAAVYIRRHCTRLSIWLMRMHAAAGEADTGALYLPAQIDELLQVLAKPFGPAALAILEAVDRGLQNQSADEDLPSSLGRVESKLNDTPLSFAAAPYVAWKLQRLRDAYRNMALEQRAEADALLKHCGFLEVCQRDVNWRLQKSGTAIQLRAPA